MKRTIAFVSIMIVISFFMTSIAQDRIIKKSDEEIPCKGIEIGSDEIRYKLVDPDDELIYGISKVDVSKIVLETGDVVTIKQEFESMDYYEGQKKSALKFGFFAPLWGYTTLSYERCLKPGMSIESSIGIIGLGKKIDQNVKDAGFSAKFAIKYINTPDYYQRGMRYYHILKGGYVKFEPTLVVYSHQVKNEYSYNYYGGYGNDPDRRDGTVTKFALMCVFGKQWVFSDAAIIDTYVGFGYGASNEHKFNSNINPVYEFISTNEDGLGLALSAGFKVGILLGKN